MSRSQPTTILLQPGGLRIPYLPDLEAFRSWAHSDEFPDRGKITWLGGEIEIDMSPEEINTHATPKGAIARRLGVLIEEQGLGVVLIDSSRVSSAVANLSAEPDVLVILNATVCAGEVLLVPKADGREGRYVEVEGAADLVVECVSDSSTAKDRRKLPPRYFRAGVGEYWLIDARPEVISFELFRRGTGEWESVLADDEGFRRSPLLGLGVRLVRIPMDSGLVRYDLETR